MRVVPLLLSAIVAVALVTGCGGSQSAQSDPPPPPAEPETMPVATPEPAPPPQNIEHVFYRVYWQGIHVMTIYQGGGSVRSEEPDNPSTVLPTRCEYMSAISHYYEHEADIAVLIERVDNLEDFLEVLVEEGHEIEEEQLEEGY